MPSQSHGAEKVVVQSWGKDALMENQECSLPRLWYGVTDKLLPLPQPSLCARTDAWTNPSAQRATQLRSVLARV
jgi:hypothetical protein